MPRPAANIQAEITQLESELGSASATTTGYTIAGRSVTKAAYDAKTKRLDFLYQQLDRVNGTAPMMVRGVPKGLH